MILDGIEYTVDTPTDNALNLLNYINQYCIDNNLKDSDGNPLQFIVNITSPIWLIILGLGYMFNTFQRLLYACGQAFSIASCSDTQILNLMELAGTDYLGGTSTTINCAVTAGSDGPCDITKDDTVTYTYEGVNQVFHPIFPVTIAAGGIGTVILQADNVGPMYISAGSITEFDTEILNLTSMLSMNALPGTLPETTFEARQRLQRGRNTAAGLDAAINALRSLTGIRTLNLFFNNSLTTDLVIADMTIPPRTCGLIVQGYSEELASTYFDYLDVPCVGGALTQDHTTLAGQTLSITYSLPEQVALHIKVKVRIPDTYIVPEGYDTVIINMLLPAGGALPIGIDYTQQYLLTYLGDFSVEGMGIVGLEVSTDGVTFTDTTDLDKNQICSIAAEDITFVEVV